MPPLLTPSQQVWSQYLGLSRPRVGFLEAWVARIQLQVFVVHASRGRVEVALRLIQPGGLEQIGAWRAAAESKTNKKLQGNQIKNQEKQQNKKTA